jgi:hypothetical protein
MEYLARTVIVGSIIEPRLKTRLLLPLLVALKLRDEDFYKKILGDVGCNATEIIEQLVTKHNAWELFNINPKTRKDMLGTTYAYNLIGELYAVSPQEWLRNVDEFVQNNRNTNNRRDSPTTSVEPQWSDEMFHPVVQTLFHLNDGKNYSNYHEDFQHLLRDRASIKFLSQCIELVDLNNENIGRWA